MGRREFNSDLEKRICSLENDAEQKYFVEENELLHLPIEIILEIISQLDEINDLKNCTLLCKQLRVLMHMTPKIMRKYEIKINIDAGGFMELPIVKKRGKFIRTLNITFKKLSRLQLMMSKVPNLEKLTYEFKHSNKSNSIKISELRHLKHIISEDPCHKCFLADSVNITKLEALRFSLQNSDDSEILTNFLSRQRNLKELTVIDDFVFGGAFLTRDISNEIKFNLTKFEYNLNDYGDNFKNFLKYQAESLKELKLRFSPTYNIFNIIFTKCKKLENFKITHDCYFTPEDPTSWMLTSLKHFSAQSVLNFPAVNKRFPNLVSLECVNIVPCEGTFSKLETLYLSGFLDCRNLIKLKLPNLKNLTAVAIEGSIWKHFKRNIPKIENLTFTGVPADVFIILRSLDYFRELKIFKQKTEGGCCRDENFGLFIDFIGRTVEFDKCRFDHKVSAHLNEKFKDYKINRLCYH